MIAKKEIRSPAKAFPMIAWLSITKQADWPSLPKGWSTQILEDEIDRLESAIVQKTGRPKSNLVPGHPGAKVSAKGKSWKGVPNPADPVTQRAEYAVLLLGMLATAQGVERDVVQAEKADPAKPRPMDRAL